VPAIPLAQRISSTANVEVGIGRIVAAVDRIELDLAARRLTSKPRADGFGGVEAPEQLHKPQASAELSFPKARARTVNWLPSFDHKHNRSSMARFIPRVAPARLTLTICGIHIMRGDCKR
jgi:hypothetical protein